VHFDASPATLYAINYRSRLVTRVLAPVITFDCHSDRYLYRTARDIDWSELLTLDDTFAVFATVSNSNITHSQFAARRLKDAIVDQFRDQTGLRPSVRTPDPDLWLNLHIHENRAVISIDTSGGSLHRRGYRKESVEAPMQETLAAAIIRLTGWNGERPLLDPMCGSGTLLAEAYMHAARIPPAFGRDLFGFQRLPDFDETAWRAVRSEADGAIRSLDDGLITGGDFSPIAARAARENLRGLPGADTIRIARERFEDHPGLRDGVIVTNPPYGLRIGNDSETPRLWKELGDWLKQRCTGSTAFVYAGRPELLKSVGLRTAFRRPLVNGALDGRLARYDLF
jgi:putative N6-adenine-specific DNA methylase